MASWTLSSTSFALAEGTGSILPVKVVVGGESGLCVWKESVCRCVYGQSKGAVPSGLSCRGKCGGGLAWVFFFQKGICKRRSGVRHGRLPPPPKRGTKGHGLHVQRQARPMSPRPNAKAAAEDAGGLSGTKRHKTQAPRTSWLR